MKQEIEQQIAAVVQELFAVSWETELTIPEEQFGDFATNVALQLAPKLQLQPREISDKLVVALTTRLADKVTSIDIAGPGFINFRLQDSALLAALRHTPALSLQDKTVLVEYSDPNPFKPLHAGHLYTTIVGDTIARLIAYAGAKTVRINYGGDVGLHVGKSMWAITKDLGGELPDKLASIPEVDRAAWLGARYVDGNEAYETDETAKQEIIEYNRRVYEVHATDDHESPFAHIYWMCRDWSYQYFATLYSQLEVVPFDRFIAESEVTPLGLATVKDQLSKGVYQESDGAIIFDGEKYGLHTRVFINSAGLPTYETKEVGLSLTKWQDYHFDQSIIITANEQDQYMQVVLKSLEQFAPELAQRTKHITHGVVKLQGGVKMSSRKGNVVTAMDILDAARAAGEATGTNPTEQTILAAVKYAFVKNRVGTDIAYDPNESIALEGNSGPYLQYAHARARSILSKHSSSVEALSGTLEAPERSLLRKLTEYEQVIERSVAELMPHYICTYLYELAQNFNRFYEHNHVIGDDREMIRIALVQLYADRLKQGLELLGIEAPEHM